MHAGASRVEYVGLPVVTVWQVFVYFTYLVVAGVIVDWYFTPAGTNGVKKVDCDDRFSRRWCLTPLAKVKSGLVNRWFFNTLVYHLGTVAFGALIIAIIRFVRTVVTYLERKTKARQNRVQRAVYSCVHVCLKYQPRSARVQVARHLTAGWPQGPGLCPGQGVEERVRLRRPVREGVPAGVIGRLCIALAQPGPGRCCERRQPLHCPAWQGATVVVHASGPTLSNSYILPGSGGAAHDRCRVLRSDKNGCIRGCVFAHAAHIGRLRVITRDPQL